MSLRARPDRTFPGGVHIGPRSYVAFEACVLTHDRTRGLYLHTRVGQDCFIGARSLILPGVTVGNNVIVAAGAIVTRDVPSGCVVAGNPARILRRSDQIGPYGRFHYADESEADLARRGLT
ncbi:acyltransferase [Litoreibacter ponti]|nr:acyltransferase [Litoreibacter ponti]